MTPIPVICDNCKRLWVTESLFGVEPGATAQVTLTNVGVGPCPYCSGTGHIPDGLYELRSNTVRYLGALSADELQALLNLINRAKHENLDADQVAERIENEVPAASPLGGLLKQGGTPLAAWLTLLVTVIGFLLPLARREEKPLSQQQIEQAFVQALERVRDESAQPQTPTQTEPKPGRNDPCWCGSGKKYKHCHGR